MTGPTDESDAGPTVDPQPEDPTILPEEVEHDEPVVDLAPDDDGII